MSDESVYGWNETLGKPLVQKLKDDLKTAMLAKDNEVKSAIRMIMGEYPKLTVPMTLESGKKTTRLKTPEEITDEDLLAIIRGLAKSEKTVLEIKKEETSDYLEILTRYLPKMADKAEITEWIKANIDFGNLKSPAQAMGSVMKHFGKLADGKMVQEILKELN
jgi:hypothetical protein